MDFVVENRKELISKMKKSNIDMVVFVPSNDLFYFTGNMFQQSERLFFYLLRNDNTGFYVIPKLEASKLKTEPSDQVFTYSDEQGINHLLESLKEALSPLGKIALNKQVTRIVEKDFLNQLIYDSLVDSSIMINELRLYKKPLEINRIKRAAEILEESLEVVIPLIRPGITEMEIAARLELEMRLRGSSGTPFGTIVASGYRGALPHGRASDKVIEDGDLIVIDFGSIYEGYVADMTRVIGVGNISQEKKEVYEIVKLALETAYHKIEIGMEIEQLDAIARDIITSAGYGKHFTHRLGHGIGLDGHEAPYIMKGNKNKLTEGMVFTIEPGIYLKGEFGIRIEDNIVITETGKKNLMTMSRDLILI